MTEKNYLDKGLIEVKTLSKITNTNDIDKLKEFYRSYKKYCDTQDWKTLEYIEKIQMLLNSFKIKYNLTETEWSKLYVKFVLS